MCTSVRLTEKLWPPFQKGRSLFVYPTISSLPSFHQNGTLSGRQVMFRTYLQKAKKVRQSGSVPGKQWKTPLPMFCHIVTISDLQVILFVALRAVVVVVIVIGVVVLKVFFCFWGCCCCCCCCCGCGCNCGGGGHLLHFFLSIDATVSQWLIGHHAVRLTKLAFFLRIMDCSSLNERCRRCIQPRSFQNVNYVNPWHSGFGSNLLDPPKLNRTTYVTT